ELAGEVHRALHVGEENRHLLALALDGRARGEDFVGEVLGRVGKGAGGPFRGSRPFDLAAALRAELRVRRGRHAASRAAQAQPPAAFEAELGRRRIVVQAGWAVHRLTWSFPRNRTA